MQHYDTAPDRATAQRMAAEFAATAARIGARPLPEATHTWGWRGRTLSGTIALDDATVWMRLACSRPDAVVDTFWRGNLTASQLPPGIPRPDLLAFDEYTHDGYAYAREIYEHSPYPALSTTSAISSSLTLDDSWWASLRSALATLAETPTERMTIHPHFLERIIREMLGPDAPTDPGTPWVTAHGDLHWANLAGPQLTIYDWEGWGLAPAGYDAATLLCHSLRTPRTTMEVSMRLADQLVTPTGRYATAAVLAEHLWKLREAPDDPHATVMRGHASMLLSPTGSH